MFGKRHRFRKTLLAFALLAVAACVYLGRGPDFETSLEREVPIARSETESRKLLDHLDQWPMWNQMMVAAKGELKAGGELVLTFDPRGLKWRRYEVRARVDRYEPGHLIDLTFLSDSKGKVSKVFQDLHWSVEIDPKGVRGFVRATTKTARARFFGRIAERSIMNQVFYPDLMKLAGVEPPGVFDFSGGDP